MRALFIATVCLVLMSLPALAQDDGGELMSGYRLGKFHATASILAHELTMVTALIEETGLADVTDVNYAEGLIGDEDLEIANMVLAYSIWRCEFMILPVCGGGLESDSFSHPALDAYRDPTMEILTGVMLAAEEFGTLLDYDGLLEFSATIQEGEYVEDLLLLAELAASDAGEV